MKQTDRPTRESLRSQLIPGSSRGARRHNRNLLAAKRREWVDATHAPQRVSTPKPKPEATPNKPQRKVTYTVYSTQIYQQSAPGQCPICYSTNFIPCTVTIRETGAQEVVRDCQNCRNFFRKRTVTPTPPPAPVAAAQPKRIEVDDYYALPALSWGSTTCSACGGTCNEVVVYDKFYREEVSAFECTKCKKLFKL